jgi:hypothetical protein
VHVAPACAGSDHFGSYVCSISLHFCKRLFLGLGHKATALPIVTEFLLWVIDFHVACHASFFKKGKIVMVCDRACIAVLAFFSTSVLHGMHLWQCFGDLMLGFLALPAIACRL